MKLSLKDLFAIVGVFAVVFGCAAYVGFGNPLFWTTVVGSIFMSATFISAIRRNPERTPKSPIVFLALGFLFASITWLANALILLIAGAKLARNGNPTRREAFAVVAVGLVVSLTIGMAPGHRESRRLAALHEKYPLISLADRLAYEKNHQPTFRLVANATSNHVYLQLLEDEERIDRASYQNSVFGRIHYEQQEQFVRAIGFGIGRMSFYALVPTIEDRPPLRDIRFDECRTEDSKSEVPAKFSFNQLHASRQKDFLDPLGFGAVVKPGPISVGFIPHAIHEPHLATPSVVVEKLELVSLLKFDEPRVYVLDHMPRMDQLSSANSPTRALDKFETGALAKLWSDEDVVIAEGSDQMRMLGSLRAAKQCLACHAVERGELLGAFSYRIRLN